jgi:zinc transport system substrate-binding protein
MQLISPSTLHGTIPTEDVNLHPHARLLSLGLESADVLGSAAGATPEERGMRILRWCLLFAVAGSFLAAGAGTEERLKAFVSIEPQAYFVERVGGERVAVQALVKSGQSPATYEPSPRQMAALSESKLYFRIGVPFEKALLPKIEGTIPGLRVVDTRVGVPLREMKARPCPGSSGKDRRGDNEDARNGNEGKDPHIWLSPRRVKLQARTIATALAGIDPKGRQIYERNYAAFAEDLDRLDSALAETLKPVQGKSFLVFHPSWGYFAEDYGLRQEAIEMEGKEPTGRQLARIIEEAKAEGVKVIFVQPQFSRSMAEAVADAIGGEVVTIDPLAGDYIQNLRSVADTVREALG